MGSSDLAGIGGHWPTGHDDASMRPDHAKEPSAAEGTARLPRFDIGLSTAGGSRSKQPRRSLAASNANATTNKASPDQGLEEDDEAAMPRAEARTVSMISAK